MERSLLELYLQTSGSSSSYACVLPAPCLVCTLLSRSRHPFRLISLSQHGLSTMRHPISFVHGHLDSDLKSISSLTLHGLFSSDDGVHHRVALPHRELFLCPDAFRLEKEGRPRNAFLAGVVCGMGDLAFSGPVVSTICCGIDDPRLLSRGDERDGWEGFRRVVSGDCCKLARKKEGLSGGRDRLEVEEERKMQPVRGGGGI